MISSTIWGDMEIVELLLGAGADPSFKNDLGQDAVAMCKSFPELRGVLEKRERKMKLRGTRKKTGVVEVLGKRISTATTIQHEMWYVENDLGMNAFDICNKVGPFPSVTKVLNEYDDETNTTMKK